MRKFVELLGFNASLRRVDLASGSNSSLDESPGFRRIDWWKKGYSRVIASGHLLCDVKRHPCLRFPPPEVSPQSRVVAVTGACPSTSYAGATMQVGPFARTLGFPVEDRYVLLRLVRVPSSVTFSQHPVKKGHLCHPHPPSGRVGKTGWGRRVGAEDPSTRRNVLGRAPTSWREAVYSRRAGWARRRRRGRGENRSRSASGRTPRQQVTGAAPATVQPPSPGGTRHL